MIDELCYVGRDEYPGTVSLSLFFTYFILGYAVCDTLHYIGHNRLMVTVGLVVTETHKSPRRRQLILFLKVGVVVAFDDSVVKLACVLAKCAEPFLICDAQFCKV